MRADGAHIVGARLQRQAALAVAPDGVGSMKLAAHEGGVAGGETQHRQLAAWVGDAVVADEDPGGGLADEAGETGDVLRSPVQRRVASSEFTRSAFRFGFPIW
jgi:hypothetical protein